MPRYDYVCKCGHEQEEVMSIKKHDGATIICDKCGTLMRQSYAPPLIVVPVGKCGNAWNGYVSQSQTKEGKK